MPYDFYHLNIIVDDLKCNLTNGRIDKVSMPFKETLGLGVYANGKNHFLVISAQAEAAAIFISKKPKELIKPDTNSFLLAIKKHLMGAVIKDISTSDFERVVTIEVETRDQLGYMEKRFLIAELMGRYSNIFLLNNDKKIIAVLKNFPLDINAKRPQFCGSEYTPAPPQPKLDIGQRTEISRLLAAFKGENMASFLMKELKGFSQLTINEMIYRTFEGKQNDIFLQKNSQENIDLLLDFMQEFCCNYRRFLHPVAIMDAQKPTDFAAFLPTFQPTNTQDFDNINDAAAFYFYHKMSSGAFYQVQKKLTSAIKSALNKAQKKLGNLLYRVNDCRDFERNKVMGDLILSNLFRIKDGDEQAVVEDFYQPNCPLITIKLDKKLSVKANAQRYYKKYTKQKKTIEQTQGFLDETQNAVDYLSGLLEAAEACQTLEDLADLTEEIEHEGIISTKSKTDKKKQAVSQPRCFEVDGFKIYAGKNNLQNDALTKQAAGRDLWFHAQGVFGSHVVIKGSNPPQHIVLIAASIAAFFSKASKSDKVAVDYTEVKFVKKPPSSPPGKVIYSNQKTILVEPKLPK